jgi:hypothetical protein
MVKQETLEVEGKAARFENDVVLRQFLHVFLRLGINYVPGFAELSVK